MSDGRIVIDTQIDSSGAESGIKSLGGMASAGLNGIATAGKAMGAAIGVATVAVGGLVKASIEQYSQYEQLTGGVETLFKNSSNTVMDYANNAYKTAGMSANEYMSTITGFSASLLQGLGGDTAKAAEIGNMAVIDMSDNANKMGTAIENIQNAYQGFAKQNYTMLDNLKLGYGGTKTEMERLLADAGKLTGIKYDINNFSDVIAAIHAIQTQMGITGTTAKEASSTIEGSLNMTKSAWANLLTGMADDNANFDTLINNLVTSAGAFGNNILPRIEIALNGVGQLIDTLFPIIANKIPEILATMLPKLAESGTKVIMSLVEGIKTNLPAILTAGVEILTTIVNGLSQALPQLVEMLPQIISAIIDFITQNLETILTAGINILVALINGLTESIPKLVEMLPQIIDTIVRVVTENLPQIIDAGVKLLIAIIDGLTKALPQLVDKIPEIIKAIVDALMNNLPQIIEAGVKINLAIAKGLIDAIPKLILEIPKINLAIVDAFAKYDWSSVGKNIMLGIGKGLPGAESDLIKKVATVVRNVKDTFTNNDGFKIKSPSRWARDMVGKNIVKGIGVGIDAETPNLLTDSSDMVRQLQASMDFNTARTTANIVGSANRTAAISNTSNSATTNNNAPLFSVENFYNERDTDIPTIAQELAFYGKRNPAR